MKAFIISILTLLLTISLVAQNNCSKYYAFNEGTTFQITNYDKKGKTVGIIDYSVTSVRTIEGEEIATITSVVKDKKGEMVLESSYDITCKDDGISIDFKSLVNPQMLTQYGEFDVDITGTNLDLPNNLSVGQELPDASMEMTVSMGIILNITVYITNRKVLATENITTPAGTFDCFVLTSTSELKMGIKQKGTSKEWIAEGVGIVKQESYNKKGKLIGYSLLTAYNE